MVNTSQRTPNTRISGMNEAIRPEAESVRIDTRTPTIPPTTP